MHASGIHTDLARRLSCVEKAPLLRDLFGTTDTEAVAHTLLSLLNPFGNVHDICLVRLSAGLVIGVDVDEPVGRVVLKVHRGHVVPRLSGVLRAQRILGTGGIGVAHPLVDSAIPIANGAAIIETWHVEGATVDVRPAPIRRALARCSFLISELLDPALFPEFAATWTGRYPPPHSPHFDFVATTRGAEWIDELADHALNVRSALVAAGIGRRIVAHTDLRPENILIGVRASETIVSSVYDLDSLCVDAEPWMLGGTARAFSTNWSLDDPMLPTVAEIHAFLNDYQDVRATPFSPQEARLAQAGTLHALAYSARCEHALYGDGSPAPWGSGWRGLLREWADANA